MNQLPASPDLYVRTLSFTPTNKTSLEEGAHLEAGLVIEFDALGHFGVDDVLIADARVLVVMD
jgi:hypothetical protein